MAGGFVVATGAVVPPEEPPEPVDPPVVWAGVPWAGVVVPLVADVVDGSLPVDPPLLAFTRASRACRETVGLSKRA